VSDLTPDRGLDAVEPSTQADQDRRPRRPPRPRNYVAACRGRIVRADGAIHHHCNPPPSGATADHMTGAPILRTAETRLDPRASQPASLASIATPKLESSRSWALRPLPSACRRLARSRIVSTNGLGGHHTDEG